MNNVWIYEILLNGMIAANSGEISFDSENAARIDALQTVDYLIEDEYAGFQKDDFHIMIFESNKENLSNGW